MEEHLERFLDLGFLRESVSCYPLLYLQWGELDETYTRARERMDDDSSRLCDIDTVRHIPQEK